MSTDTVDRSSSQTLQAACERHNVEPPDHLPEPGEEMRLRDLDKPGDRSGYIVGLNTGNGFYIRNYRDGSPEAETVFYDGKRSATPEERQEIRRKQIEHRAKVEAEQRQAAADCERIWFQLPHASPDHAYLRRKGISQFAQFFRQIDGDWSWLGHGLRGPVLVARIEDHQGRLTSLQYIDQDGVKLFHQGGRISGAAGWIEGRTRTVCVAEGFATGLSIYAATGHAVAVSLSSGNLPEAAALVGYRWPGATVVICSDLPGERFRVFDKDGSQSKVGEVKHEAIPKAHQAALRIAENGRTYLAVPDFTGLASRASGSDFNDLQRVAGSEAVARQITNAAYIPTIGELMGPPQSMPERLAIESAGELDGTDLPEDTPQIFERLVIKEPGTITLIAGQSGAGKSSFAIGLAVCLSAGVDFLNLKSLEKIGVVYLAGEGAGGIDKRRHTFKQRHGVQGKLPICTVKRFTMLNPHEPASIAEFEGMIRSKMDLIERTHGVRTGVVFLDTLSTCVVINDENSNSEAIRYMNTLRQIGERLGVVFIPVHHYGKDAAGGVRGASATEAMADIVFAILVERDQATGQVTNRLTAFKKSRDGQDGPYSGFELEIVNLGYTLQGLVRSSTYFKYAELKKLKRKKSDEIITDAIEAEMKDGKAVEVAVRARFELNYPNDDRDNRNRAYRRAKDKILDNGIYDYRDGGFIK